MRLFPLSVQKEYDAANPRDPDDMARRNADRIRSIAPVDLANPQ